VERLMMLRLWAKGCAVEAHLNGMCVASVGPEGGSVTLPVHEYTMEGRNRMSFVAGAASLAGAVAPPQPRRARGDLAVQMSLALCHTGQSPADPNVQVLSQLSWSPAVDEQHDWPFSFSRDVELPVRFPRWRWLDAPTVTPGPALDRQVLELLQGLALDFHRGDADAFLQLSRLRTEELALAYQRSASDWVQGMRDHFQALFEAGSLGTVLPPEPGSFVLRPLADGRLVEPLMPDGSPVLKTEPGADPLQSQAAWPLRLAQVEGKLYILR
jgi:hypothetical protein